ncbi:MAG: thioredoxin domain-containing protein [Candidatus Schekmanbacteria bacterium]|nr:thioredoxin domain-containing protein [Candidatus Schekmanbacteria bacterium]
MNKIYEILHSRKQHIAALFISLLFLTYIPAPAFSAESKFLTNNLKNARSPYLREAASEPVPWQEWSEETLAEAKRLDRPVLLDIGAYWCYWCRRMDNDTYSNPEIAKIIKENFIAIKVDRDERPDIDSRYQELMSMLGFPVGWPLTVVMAPDGLPFYGATYLPPDDTDKLQGLKGVLNKGASFYRQNRKELKSQTAFFFDRIVKSEAGDTKVKSDEILNNAASEILLSFDKEHGGFVTSGSAKFPQETVLAFLMRHYMATGKSECMDAVTLSLKKMFNSTLYDHAEGGFFRYSEKADWSRPHFEKMLTDNAMLASIYLRAYRISGKNDFMKIGVTILDFMESFMKDSKTSAYYSSIAAVRGNESEGDYYSFDEELIKKALSPKEIDYFNKRFKLIPIEVDGHGKRFLLANNDASSTELPELESKVMIKLKLLRNTFAKPDIDRSFYTDSNALAVLALLDGYRGTGKEEYKSSALKAMDFLISKSFIAGKGFSHFPLPSGTERKYFLKDQALSGIALIDCYGVTADRKYLDRAVETANILIKRFYSKKPPGFLSFYSEISSKIQNVTQLYSAPSVDIDDIEGPSGNAAAIAFLDKIYLLTEDEKYSNIVKEALSATKGAIRDNAFQTAGLASALYDYEFPPLKAVIVYRKGDSPSIAARDALAKEVLKFNYPGTLINYIESGASGKTYILPPDKKAILYPCIGTTCYKSVTDAAKVADSIKEIIKK